MTDNKKLKAKLKEVQHLNFVYKMQLEKMKFELDLGLLRFPISPDIKPELAEKLLEVCSFRSTRTNYYTDGKTIFTQLPDQPLPYNPKLIGFKIINLTSLAKDMFSHAYQGWDNFTATDFQQWFYDYDVLMMECQNEGIRYLGDYLAKFSPERWEQFVNYHREKSFEMFLSLIPDEYTVNLRDY